METENSNTQFAKRVKEIAESDNKAFKYTAIAEVALGVIANDVMPKVTEIVKAFTDEPNKKEVKIEPSEDDIEIASVE